MNFKKELQRVLKNYNRDEALSLCDKLHEIEGNGGNLSAKEERLWVELTERLESEER